MDIVSYAMGEGAGYSKGYSAGYDEGLDANAYQEGYTDGEAAGYTTGYDKGYTDGAASITSLKAVLDCTKSTKNLFSIPDAKEFLTDAELQDLIKYDDTENVVSMEGMFRNQKLLTSIPLLNTSNVTNMASMFTGGSGSIPPFNDGGTPPLFDTSNVTNITSMFEAYSNNPLYQNNMTALPLYDFGKVTSCERFLRGCRGLTSVPALNFKKLSTSSSDFASIYWAQYSSIREIHIVDIHYNFNISYSTSFTREALVEIIGNLRDMTGSTAKTLTMGSTNMAKLTADDIAVATGKNWTIA